MYPLRTEIVPLSEVPSSPQAGEGHIPVVLVVDDEHLVADTLALIFKRAGFRAFAAYSAQGALELASAMAPDVLVSDVDMPRMNGVDLALTLLKMTPECEVILFSGHATFADLAKARAEGHDFPLLPKPVHPDEMLQNVEKCLRSSRAPRARMANLLVMPGVAALA